MLLLALILEEVLQIIVIIQANGIIVLVGHGDIWLVVLLLVRHLEFWALM